MGLENVDRCQHVKVNGTQCGSPALRRRRLCFFHLGCKEQRARIAESQFKQARFVVPVLEDANSVQMALMQVMEMLSSGQMEHKMAALLLYALQTATCNLRNTEFEAEDVEDVVIDRSTVNRTCIGGPQWVEADFDDDEDEVGDEEGAAEGAEGTQEGAAGTAAVAEEGVKACAQEPKERVSIDEARRRVQRVVLDWAAETVMAEVANRPG
jgi:hypothetical protein